AGDPAPSPKKNEKNDDDKKMRPRRRENVAPAAAPQQNQPNKSASADEMLRSADLEVDQSVTRFDDSAPKFEERNQPSANQQQQNNNGGDGQQKNDGHREDRQQQARILNIKDFDGAITNEGVLELMQDGYGFL